MAAIMTIGYTRYIDEYNLESNTTNVERIFSQYNWEKKENKELIKPFYKRIYLKIEDKENGVEYSVHLDSFFIEATEFSHTFKFNGINGYTYVVAINNTDHSVSASAVNLLAGLSHTISEDDIFIDTYGWNE